MRRYMQSFLMVSLISAASVQSMGLVCRVGHIDQQLIARYARLTGAKKLIANLKKGRPAQLVPRPRTQRIDIAHYTHVPAVTFKLYCSHYNDPLITLDHPLLNNPLGYQKDVSLVSDIYKKIAAIEAKSGYIPEGIVKQNKDFVCVTMATNRLCENTRYWRVSDCDKSCDIPLILTETRLYREHYDEVKELLKHQLNLP